MVRLHVPPRKVREASRRVGVRYASWVSGTDSHKDEESTERVELMTRDPHFYNTEPDAHGWWMRMFLGIPRGACHHRLSTPMAA